MPNASNDIHQFLISNNKTEARTALGAIAATDITSGTITPGTVDVDFDTLGGGGADLTLSNLTDYFAARNNLGVGFVPEGYLHCVSVKNTSTVKFNVKHDGSDSATGVCWSVNGSSPVYHAVAADTLSSVYVPHDGGVPLEIWIWPAASTSSGRVGNLTYLSSVSGSIFSLDVSGLTSLSYLGCQQNNLTSLTLGNLPSLTALNCGDNNLTSLDVSGLSSLTDLNCGNNNLTSLTLGNLPSLTGLNCNDNNLTSLDVSGLTSLYYMNCYGNDLTSLDLSGLTSLNIFSCSNNPTLTSIRAVGVSTSYYHYHSWSYALDITLCSLDAAALDQFYTDLAPDPASTGTIEVTGNPGTTGDDPTIATAKGYTVIGT